MPPAREIPRKKEQHVVACALCGAGDVSDSQRAKDMWIERHMRRDHSKMNGFLDNAARSVTILYEKKVEGSAQEPGHVDPTSTFLRMINMMNDRGMV